MLYKFFLPLYLFCNAVLLDCHETIYAIMVTGKDQFHEELARQAMKSFREQTYPNKHLIIINDGDYELGSAVDITEVKFSQKHVLGELRNIALSYIPLNALWAQWDDDDWHHPEFLEKQYIELIKSRADGICCLRQVQYAFQINAAWIYSRLIEGTIMCRKKEGVYYPKSKMREDTIFLENYEMRYKVAYWDNPAYFYIRFIHGHNTWNDRHFRLQNRKRDFWDLNEKESTYLEAVLENYSNISYGKLLSRAVESKFGGASPPWSIASSSDLAIKKESLPVPR